MHWYAPSVNMRSFYAFFKKRRVCAAPSSPFTSVIYVLFTPCADAGTAAATKVYPVKVGACVLCREQLASSTALAQARPASYTTLQVATLQAVDLHCCKPTLFFFSNHQVEQAGCIPALTYRFWEEVAQDPCQTLLLALTGLHRTGIRWVLGGLDLAKQHGQSAGMASVRKQPAATSNEPTALSRWHAYAALRSHS